MSDEYPDTFVKEARRLFPPGAAIHRLLETNDAAVGRFLDDVLFGGLSFVNTASELRALTIIIQRRTDSAWMESVSTLHTAWHKFYIRQRRSQTSV